MSRHRSLSALRTTYEAGCRKRRFCSVSIGVSNQAVQPVPRRLPDVVPAPELPVFAACNERRARRLRAVGLGLVVLGALWVVAFFAGAIDFGRLPGIPQVVLGASGLRSAHETGNVHPAVVVPAAEPVDLSASASSTPRSAGPHRSISPARPTNRPDHASRRSKSPQPSSSTPLVSPLAPPPAPPSPAGKAHGRGSRNPARSRQPSAPPGKPIATRARPRKVNLQPPPPPPGSTHVPPGLRLPR